MYGWRGRIGVIYPSSGLRDADFHRLIPEGVSAHLHRVFFKNVGTAAAIKEMSELQNLVEAGRILAHVGPSCITWADTSGSFLFGREGDLKQIKALEKATGVPASTTSTACCEAAKRLGVSKFVVASPYLSEVNQPMADFFRGRGISFLRLKSLELRDSSQIARVTPEEILGLVRKAMTKGADALFIPCTDFFDLDLIPYLERDFSLPVIAANQATMWHALRLSGINDSLSQFGRLMTLSLK